MIIKYYDGNNVCPRGAKMQKQKQKYRKNTETLLSVRTANNSPVVVHWEGNLKLGKELEVLLLSLLCEACSFKQNLHN